MTETLSASGDGSLSGDQEDWDYTIDNPTVGRSLTMYVEGDAQSTDLTIDFLLAPVDSPTDFHPVTVLEGSGSGASISDVTDANVDLTSGTDTRRAYDFTRTYSSGAIRVSITDNRSSPGTATSLTVKVDESDP